MDAAINNVPASRCPYCRSTQRTDYSNVIRKEISGTDQNGDPYNTVVWRTTKCKNCNKKRVDRTVYLVED